MEYIRNNKKLFLLAEIIGVVLIAVLIYAIRAGTLANTGEKYLYLIVVSLTVFGIGFFPLCYLYGLRGITKAFNILQSKHLSGCW